MIYLERGEKMKKFVKKSFVVATTLVLIILLASCAKEQTQSYSMTSNGVEMKLTYTYTGDKVSKQTTKSVIPYSALGVTNKEDAKSYLGPIAEAYQGVKGLKESIKYEENQAVESVEINYETVDFDELKGIPGITTSGNTDKGISMKKTEKLLKDSGFKKESK